MSMDASVPVPPAPGKPKLLEQIRSFLRVKHYSLRTEEAYLHWIKRFILFHGKRHPDELGPDAIRVFLTDLAVRGEVAASTQNQALSALLFLYQQILGRTDLTDLLNVASPPPSGRSRLRSCSPRPKPGAWWNNSRARTGSWCNCSTAAVCA